MANRYPLILDGTTLKEFPSGDNLQVDSLQVTGTGAITLAVGTTAQRPAAPNTGDMRFNTTDGSAEIYNGSQWGAVGGGGATGGGSDLIFWENDQTVTTNYEITSGKNAGTFGAITIDSGVTVTVPSGSTWTIV